MSNEVDVIARRLGEKWWYKPMTLMGIAWLKEHCGEFATKKATAYVLDGRNGDKAFRAMLDAGMVIREEDQ